MSSQFARLRGALDRVGTTTPGTIVGVFAEDLTAIMNHYVEVVREAAELKAARAQPAQAGQVLTDDALWELWNAQGCDDMSQSEAMSFARAIEQAVLARWVPMTESAWQNPLHPDQISDKPIPNWTPLYRLMGKISDPSNAQHFSAEAAVKAFCTVGEKGVA